MDDESQQSPASKVGQNKDSSTNDSGDEHGNEAENDLAPRNIGIAKSPISVFQIVELCGLGFIFWMWNDFIKSHEWTSLLLLGFGLLILQSGFCHAVFTFLKRFRWAFAASISMWSISTILLAAVAYKNTQPILHHLPEISFTNEGGFAITDYTGNPIEMEKLKYDREHSFTIGNPNNDPMYNISMVFQLPFVVVHTNGEDYPSGTVVVWKHDSGMGKMHAFASGGGTVGASPARDENGNIADIGSRFRLEINMLPAGRSVVVTFITTTRPIEMRAPEPDITKEYPNGKIHYTEGVYECPLGTKRHFFAPMESSDKQDINAGEPSLKPNGWIPIQVLGG